MSVRAFRRPSQVPVVATAELQRSLFLFITFDQLAYLGAGGVMLGVHLWLHPSGHLLLLAVIAALTTTVVGLGRRLLVAGNLEGAVLCVAVANWGAALAAAAVATFSLPITVVAAMLPSALAVPYVGARTLSQINVTSICVSLAAVLLGTTQDFSGLTGELPPWILPALLVTFMPVMSGLVVMVSMHNNARLTQALLEAVDANARLRRSERDLRESRARLVLAADTERRRIARDLHDGAQQQMVSIALGVHRARRLVCSDPAGADGLLHRLTTQIEESTADLRNLAHGLYPAVLNDLGLREALIELATRAPCHCLIEVDRLPRCPPKVESSVYWCCAEALQNVAKHAGASACARLQVGVDKAETLFFDVEDGGCGFDPSTFQPGHGVSNMADRIRAVGGELTIRAAPGGGVQIHGVVPTIPITRPIDDDDLRWDSA